MHDKILILDFGSQVTQLIARRIRELGIYSEVHPYDIDDAQLKAYAADGKLRGIILSGSHNSTQLEDAPRIADSVFTLGVPILGICYGMQVLAHQLGGSVTSAEVREFGYAQLYNISANPLLDGLEDGLDEQGQSMLQVWMSHGDSVQKLPEGFSVIAKTAHCPIAAIADLKRNWYGLQFHPEVTHTPQGKKMLAHFVQKICRAQNDWTMPHFVDEAVTRIREQVGRERVILGLSGGVDSSVAAVLIHRAIGKQLTCIFVDHGLLRLNEATMVREMFAAYPDLDIRTIDASQTFLAALEGVNDPEAKRKIIGRLFVETFQAEAQKLQDAKWLAQGTIYPDVIESAGKNKPTAHTIKSHHNVGGLPETLHLKLLEPLRELFKDEVRALGTTLGLSREMVYRHPFPGPGLAVRILGEIKENYINLLQRADAIFIEELRKASIPQELQQQLPVALQVTGYKPSWYDATSQAFAVFLPVKSVGVMGDGRTYEYVVALRAVQTQDFMTADWAPLPHSLLAKISNRIINEVRGINRVVYDISGKPPATIEWE